MGLAFRLAIKGKLQQEVEEEITAIGFGVRRAIKVASRGAQLELRRRYKLRGKLALAWNVIVFPKATVPSIDSAGWIFAKGGSRTRGAIKAVQGVVIRAGPGKRFLAIPSPLLPRRMRGTREGMTPQVYRRRMGRHLRFVKGRAGVAFLVDDGAKISGGRLSFIGSRKIRGGGRASPAVGGGRTSFIAFFLIPSANFPRQVDVNRIALKWQRRVPQLIVEELEQISEVPRK